LKEAYSTPIFPLDILAERVPEKKFEWVSNYAIVLL
jgi:translocon-associated protein subunit beta